MEAHNISEKKKKKMFQQLMDIAGIAKIRRYQISDEKFKFCAILKDDLDKGAGFIEHVMFLGDAEDVAIATTHIYADDMQMILDIALAKHKKIVFYTINAFDYEQHILIPRVQCIEELLIWLDLNAKESSLKTDALV